MKNKVWSMPEAVAEQFMPNEYVSVCFYISCDYGEGAGSTGRKGPDGHTHRAYTWEGKNTGCGWAESQAIAVLSGDISKESETGAKISITELNARLDDGSTGDLTCYFTNSNGQNRQETISGVREGNTIYWVTDVSYSEEYGSVWMLHQGQIEYSDSNRPNHS